MKQPSRSKTPTHNPTLEFEISLWTASVMHIAGIDEVGRGALAGPVVAGAVVLPPDPNIATFLQGVNDSKKLTAFQRQVWAEKLKRLVLAWGVGYAQANEVDLLGIVPATRLAVGRALQSLPFTPDHLLLDYLLLPDLNLPQTSLVKGDARSLSIAAASILAKTSRDSHMRKLDNLFPGYGFAKHKGYCTPQHLQALERNGPVNIHRLSFNPVANVIATSNDLIRTNLA